MPASCVSRRGVLAGMAGFGVFAAGPARARGATDVTFLFISDVHACRTRDGLSPNCAQQGKTDDNLLRHVRALNRIGESTWPEAIDGAATALRSAGERIAAPRGVVLAGDMTDDGGGQRAKPEEGFQLLQFSRRYQRGSGEGEVHFPVYAGLGNHDLDQDGPKDNVDWYRREMRDYVETSHRPGLFFKPVVPADDYDVASDCYSWNWDRLHLVQLHRFGGDTRKGAASSLDWLARDLARHAGDGRPVALFQHYGWDAFSIERWDPASVTFDDEGAGPPHWWTEDERAALLDIVRPYNIAGIFHGHEHDLPMLYSRGGYDLFKPTAAYLGGFGLARVTDGFMDVALGEATDGGGVRFVKAMSKPLG